VCVWRANCHSGARDQLLGTHRRAAEAGISCSSLPLWPATADGTSAAAVYGSLKNSVRRRAKIRPTLVVGARVMQRIRRDVYEYYLSSNAVTSLYIRTQADTTSKTRSLLSLIATRQQATPTLKLLRFVVDLLYSLLYNKSTTNRISGVTHDTEFSLGASSQTASGGGSGVGSTAAKSNKK